GSDIHVPYQRGGSYPDSTGLRAIKLLPYRAGPESRIAGAPPAIPSRLLACYGPLHLSNSGEPAVPRYLLPRISLPLASLRISVPWRTWLDPDCALAQRLLVGRGRPVGLDAFQVLLRKAAPDGAGRLLTGRTLGSQGTGTADRGLRAVEDALPSLGGVRAAQHLAIGAHRVVVLGVVGELRGAEVGAVLLPVRQWHVRVDTHVFHGSDVRTGSIFGVAGHL